MENRYVYDFCRTVTKQLRCKWEAVAVSRELYDHIHDHADALAAQGVEKREAEHEAVDAMGDPVELGKALDKLHSPWPWRVLHVSVFLAPAILCVTLFVAMAGWDNGWLNSWDDVLFYTDRAAAMEMVLDEHAVLAAGTVSGGGKIGPYRLWPTGGALVTSLPAGQHYFGGADTRLVFLVRSVQWRPWLEHLDCPSQGLSARDDLGNTYGFFMSSMGGRIADLQRVLLTEPDPAATRFTFTIATERGSAVFTVELEGGKMP